jgi:hypothetical protein
VRPANSVPTDRRLEGTVFSPIERAVYEAMTKRLERYFVAIVDGRDREVTFSGVKVAKRGRHFVITAGHYFDEKSAEGLDEIHIVTAQRPLTMSPTPGAVRATRPMSWYDVGVITLSPSDAAALGSDWIDAEAIDSGALVARSGQPVCALGVPDARLEWLPGDVPVAGGSRWPLVRAHLGRLKPVSLLTEVAEREASENVRSALHPEGLDVLLEFPNAVDGSEETIQTLRGMSGAGVFVVPLFEEGEIWSPAAARLVGILTEQHRTESFLQCQRIEVASQGIDEALQALAAA